MVASPSSLKTVAEDLDDICDVERIIARIAVGRASPAIWRRLQRCLELLPRLFDRLGKLERYGLVRMWRRSCFRSGSFARSRRSF